MLFSSGWRVKFLVIDASLLVGHLIVACLYRATLVDTVAGGRHKFVMT